MPIPASPSDPDEVPVQPIVWVLLGIAALIMVLGSVLVFPRWLSSPPTAADLRGLSPKERLDVLHDQRKLENDIRTALLGGLAGLSVLGGSVVGWQQLRNSRRQFVETLRQGQQQIEQSQQQLEQARQGQVTERFTRAIDQLGDNKPEVVLGGIYALERIALDAPDEYKAAIGEILTAYVRTHAPWPPAEPALNVPLDQLPRLQERTPTVQAAITVLGRGSFADVSRLDLARTDMRRANLHGANLRGASFHGANLGQANLMGVNLAGADLGDARLQRAGMSQANLQKALLMRANLEHALLTRANLRGAILMGASLQGAVLLGTDLRDTTLQHPVLRVASLVDAAADQTTQWPEGFDPGAAGLRDLAEPIRALAVATTEAAAGEIDADVPAQEDSSADPDTTGL